MRDQMISITVRRIKSGTGGRNVIMKMTGAAIVYTEDNNIIGGKKTIPEFRVGDCATDAEIDLLCTRYNVTVTLP